MRSVAAEDEEGEGEKVRKSMKKVKGRSSNTHHLQRFHSGPRGNSKAAGNLGKGPS